MTKDEVSSLIEDIGLNPQEAIIHDDSKHSESKKMTKNEAFALIEDIGLNPQEAIIHDDSKHSESKKMTKNEAFALIARCGLHIEIIYDYNGRQEEVIEYAKLAGIRMAKLSHIVIGERANSSKFIQSFGDLRRLEKELAGFRNEKM